MHSTDEIPSEKRGNETMMWAMLFVASIFATSVSVSRNSFIAYATSSDQLTLPSIYWDLFRNRFANIEGWQFSRAPYFFPDLALYSLFESLFHDYRLSIFASSWTQILALAVVMGLVMSRATGARATLCANIFLAIIITQTLISIASDVIFPQYRAFYRVMIYSYQPMLHYSSFILSMVGLLIVIDAFDQRKAWHVIALFTLTVLALLSDLLFFVFFLVPITIVTMWSLVSRRVMLRDVVRVLSVLTGAIVVAVALLRHINRQSMPPLKIHVSNFVNGFHVQFCIV